MLKLSGVSVCSIRTGGQHRRLSGDLRGPVLRPGPSLFLKNSHTLVREAGGFSSLGKRILPPPATPAASQLQRGEWPSLPQSAASERRPLSLYLVLSGPDNTACRNPSKCGRGCHVIPTAQMRAVELTPVPRQLFHQLCALAKGRASSQHMNHRTSPPRSMQMILKIVTAASDGGWG